MRNISKGVRAIPLILLVVSLLATACTPASTPEIQKGTEPPPGTKTPRPTATKAAETKLGVDETSLEDLTINVWHPWFGVEASFFESLAEEFNESNEWGFEVSLTSQINFSYLYENVTSALPTPNRPDLVIALPEHAAGWYTQEAVVELNPYADDPKYGVDASDFPFVFWNQDILASERIAMPAQRTARFLLWNQTWAGELGFDNPPANIQQFQRQTCQAHQSMLEDQIPENDGQGGWLIDTDSMTAYAWLLAFRGGVLESNDYRFLTPNNIETFKFLKSLAEESCAWQISPGSDPQQAFAERRALFVVSRLEDLPTQARAFAQAGNSDEWVATPFPGDEVLAVYGSSYVILKSTEAEQLAAWLFVRWLTDSSQDARWVETTHLFPLRNSTMELLDAYQASHPQWMQAVDLLPVGQLQPQLASWRTVKVMLGDGFDHMFRANVPSGQVAAILAQMESTSHELNK